MSKLQESPSLRYWPECDKLSRQDAAAAIRQDVAKRNNDNPSDGTCWMTVGSFGESARVPFMIWKQIRLFVSAITGSLLTAVGTIVWIATVEKAGLPLKAGLAVLGGHLRKNAFIPGS